MTKKSTRYYRDLIVELVKKEIKVRYKNNILGYAWSILNPLAQAMVFFVAFQFILKVKIENYVLFLILGLFPWQWFLNSVISSSVSMIANANLIKKTVFPREYIVYAGVLNDMVHFVLSLPVLVLFLLVYHQPIYFPHIFLFPVLVLIQLFVILGISLLVASINVFFRDLERLVAILLNMLFYATPIVYALGMIPERLKFIIYLNPLALLIINYRDIFLYGDVHWEYFLLSCAYAVGIFLLGYITFNRLKSRFAEVL
ncbi:MAG: ABC transporter permease [Patescibacteria group bacterium]